MSIIAEYIWIDAIGNLRSKARILHCNISAFDATNKQSIIDYFPMWNFDGSSTGQASGKLSDVLLNPVAIFMDPFRKNWTKTAYLVLCETLNADKSPHETNHRKQYIDTCHKTSTEDPMFGMEQEYIIMQNDKPYNWISINNPNNSIQDQSHSVSVNGALYSSAYSYCANGGDRSFGRQIVEKHFEYCLYAGISICGINAEVTPSQWEFQIGICKADEIGDHLWMARYILSRVAEEYNSYVSYEPKLMEAWNGSGCHTNFSTKKMRDNSEEKRIKEIEKACEQMSTDITHQLHLLEYGDDSNKKRLSGAHETSSYKKFTCGYSDRGCSVRIPIDKTYIEDRRPASNCDPYRVVTRMLKTIVLDMK
jgi:glutamine synthetase